MILSARPRARSPPVGSRLQFSGRTKDGVVCTKVRDDNWFQCVATNSFDKGDLTVQFLADFDSPAPGRFAITGGTRGYFGATGEVTFVDNPAPARDEVTFRFVTPR